MALKVETRNKFYETEALGANDAIKSGSGVLHTVSVCSEGSSDSYIIIRDSTSSASGGVIASITTASKGSFVFDVEFVNGLSMQVSGTTSPKITISYR